VEEESQKERERESERERGGISGSEFNLIEQRRLCPDYYTDEYLSGFGLNQTFWK